MRALVVFFANAGHTRHVASEIARGCGGDLEEIVDARPHAGACEGLRYVRDSLFSATPPIEAPSRNPADYDLVILGTPVCAWQVSAPMRSYALQNATRFKRVAFFCTDGGLGSRRVFAEFGRLCGRPPVATFLVTAPPLAAQEPKHPDPLQQFMSRLQTV